MSRFHRGQSRGRGGGYRGPSQQHHTRVIGDEREERSSPSRDVTLALRERMTIFPYKNLFYSKAKVEESFRRLVSFSRKFVYDFNYTGYLIETDIRKDMPVTFFNYDSRSPSFTSHFMHFERSYEDGLDWLVDFFIEDSRMMASRPHQGRQTSPNDEWYRYGSYVEKAVEYAMKNTRLSSSEFIEKVGSLDSNTLFQLREGLYHQREVAECPNESPSFLKCLFEYLGIAPDKGSVFDGAAGWGDKLVACIAIGCKRYLGVDPNLNSTTGFHEMVEMLGRMRHPEMSIEEIHQRYAILPLPMPDCKLPAEEGTFDISFLSPPSFDSEVYSNDSGQSINVFASKDVWLWKFLIPTVARCFRMLKEGGYLIVQSILIAEIEPYITGYMKYDGDNDIGNFSTIFLGPISITDRPTNPLKRGRFKPMWIWKKVHFGEVSSSTPIDAKTIGTSGRIITENILRTFYRRCLFSGPFDWDAESASKDLRADALVMKEFTYQNVPGFRMTMFPSQEKGDIGRLRAKVWSESGTLVRYPYRYEDILDGTSSSDVWLDDNEANFIHITIRPIAEMAARISTTVSLEETPIIASSRVGVYESADKVDSIRWLLKDKNTRIDGPIATIERLVVHPALKRKVVRGFIIGGELGKTLDIYAINYARVVGCRWVFCDVPPYRIKTLESMGFKRDLFLTKKSARSKTPEIEWTGMLLDLDEVVRGRGNVYLHTSLHSSYFHPLSFSSPTKSYYISGNSGLMKNALRRVLQQYSGLIIRESSERLPYTDFVSLEWNYGNGKIDKTAQDMKCGVRNILNDEKERIANKHRLYDEMLRAGGEKYMCVTYPISEVRHIDKVMIVRPVGGLACSGRDIFVVKSDEELGKAREYLRRNKRYTSVIASEYIMNPMLFGGKKMHIRMYCLIRSAAENVPYGVFLFDIGKVLTASKEYVQDDWSNKLIHDTHADTTECNLWYPYNLKPMVGVHSQMQEVCFQLGKIMEGHTHPYPESKSAYEVFGCDFMITTDHQVKLIEVNSKVEFTTVCEPYEVGREYALVEDHFDKAAFSERRDENRNLLSMEEYTPRRPLKTATYPLTFGYFSEAMYKWIATNGILPYIS